MSIYGKLTRGLNLWGHAASVSMLPGQALDSQDVLLRTDGAFYKHYGWDRINPTALGARIVAHKGFTYKGKNNNTALNPGRAGNFAIADDAGAVVYTRRVPLYTTALILTEAECRYWDPVTQTLAGPVGLPGGVALDLDPKPTILILQNNAYIVGWATANLRYDPVDRALYVWGWEAVPVLAGAFIANAAGGTLVPNATYRYRAAWVDLYTGEESGLSAEIARQTTGANRTINFAAGAFAAYAGPRHFIDGANLTNEDVGLVLYRTDADQYEYHFLTMVLPNGTPAPPCGGGPGLVAVTVSDNGLGTEASMKADVLEYQDAPRFNFLEEWRNQWYGVAWEDPGRKDVPIGVPGPRVGNFARLYYNDFRSEKSFLERWDVRNFRELPLKDGEVLTAVAKTNRSMITFSNLTAYEVNTAPNVSTGRIDIMLNPTEWIVGCVGPRAWDFADGWLYFLSDRGPYRWTPGMPTPQWIGRDLLPMFLDTESGLCRMTESLRLESEVLYDRDAAVVRWLFPCGTTMVLNRHLIYNPRVAAEDPDGCSAWGFMSCRAQAMDYTNAYYGMVGGAPPDPFDRRPRFMFSEGGFLYRFEPTSIRGGLPAASPARGVIQAGSNINLVVTWGGLYVTGQGMAGLRLEVVHTDGTIDVRTILNNNATDIVPTVALSQDPTGGTWYVAGIPAYWRSWVDSMGNPAAHKDLIHLSIGYNRETGAPTPVVDVTVSASAEWPSVASRVRTATLDGYREKLLIALVGRYFTYEFANSRPDERFMISYIEPEARELIARRR